MIHADRSFVLVQSCLVRDSSAVRRLFVRLAGAVERQSALHKENSGFPAPTPGSEYFHVSWLSDFIFYPKPLYKSLHQSFFYSFITILPSESGVYTRLLHDFAVDPLISPFHFHFQTFVTWLRENYDYRNVSWEMICIYDLTLSKMREENITHALSEAHG